MAFSIKTIRYRFDMTPVRDRHDAARKKDKSMEQRAIGQRSGGRPDRQGLASLELRLIENAARLFTQQGYDATSIDQIASAAGVGKPTIYRRYPTKDHLFKAVLKEHLFQRFLEAWAQRMEYLAKVTEGSSGSALEALKLMCRITLDLILDPDVVNLYRLMIAEERRSTLSAEEIETTCLVFEGVIFRQIEAAQQAGELPPRLSPYAGHALMALLSGWAHKQTLLLGAVVGADERDAYFDCAWNLFLNGARASVSR